MTSREDRPRWDRRDTAALAVVALVACALHWQFVLLARIPLNTDWLTHRFEPWRSALKLPRPHNPELDDPAVLHYPLWQLARRTIRAGHWPLWNPHILCGTPLLADSMCNPFDPVNLVTLPLPDDVAWGLMILVHSVIAGWGAYVYLRALGLRRPAGIAAAACYMLNGFFIVWMELKFVVACFCWAFWLLWAVDVATRTLRLRWALLAGLFYGFAVLAGNLHHVLNLTLFVGLYMLFRLWCVWCDNGWPRLRAAAGTIALGIVFGVCLSAPQWAPTYELTGLCSREAGKYARGNFLHWGELLAAIAPEFFGHPVDGNFWGVPFFGRSFLTMNSPYVGAFALPFILLGAFWARRRESRFFAVVGLGVLAFLLGLGWGPLHRALGAILPIDTLDHHRLLVLPALCAAAVVGFGMDYLATRRAGRPPRLAVASIAAVFVAVAFVVLAAMGLFGASADAGRLSSRVQPAGFGWSSLVAHLGRLEGQGGPLFVERGLFVLAPQVLWSLVALTAGAIVAAWWLHRPRGRALPATALAALVAELLYFGCRYNPYVPRDRVYPDTPAIRFLQANAGGARILGVEPKLADRWKGDVIPPSSGLCYGIDDVRGKEGMFPRRTRQFLETLRRRQDVRFIALVHFSHADSRLFDLLGARYVVSHPALEAPHLRPVFEGELRVYENPRALPRAFTCGKAFVFQSDGDLLAHMHRPGFDPRAAVLLDAAPELVAPDGARPAAVEILDAEPNRVVLSVDAPDACYLVLADSNFPGWRATVDGRRAIVHNAYYLLRGVSVPQGKHEVVFDYWPVSFQVGLALCVAAALAAVLGGLAACLRRGRSRGPRLE